MTTFLSKDKSDELLTSLRDATASLTGARDGEISNEARILRNVIAEVRTARLRLGYEPRRTVLLEHAGLVLARRLHLSWAYAGKCFQPTGRYEEDGTAVLCGARASGTRQGWPICSSCAAESNLLRV